jgi:uncharacterized protein (DUF885 family)
VDNRTHRSAVFAFADEVVRDDAAADPIFATEAGIAGYDHLLPDFSPARTERDAERTRAQVRALAELPASDDVDRLAFAVMSERLTTRHDLVATGEAARTFSVISSPVGGVRQAFELMRASTPEDLEVIATRLRAVAPAFASWRETVGALSRGGTLPPRRHVLGVAAQAESHAAGGYESFVRGLAPRGGDAELLAAAAEAEAACAGLASWLRDEVAPHATERDACGLERYRVWARNWMGADLDLEELYAWGWDDLRRLNARMWEIAASEAPGVSSLVELAEHFDADPARVVEGPDELLRRLVELTASTVEELDGVHFDIDPRVRFCDARLAPEGTAAAPYYIPPSEDLRRPGTTWFPTLGATRFAWWRLVSTWYHEAVPGHHLQCAASILAADRQSRFHRLEAWTSGYGEGWALYAERLMDELGYFEDPAHELGYLEGQALRAARVVVDLGLHLELAAPADLGALDGLGECGGRVWTPAMAVAVLEEFALQPPAMAASEVDRYLGWPAQAISYKVGERAWLRAREAARSRLGGGFSLSRFHAHALALGPMGLDPLEEELARWGGE